MLGQGLVGDHLYLVHDGAEPANASQLKILGFRRVAWMLAFLSANYPQAHCTFSSEERGDSC